MYSKLPSTASLADTMASTTTTIHSRMKAMVTEIAQFSASLV